MKNSVMKSRAAVAVAGMMAAVVSLAGCSTPHAVPVDCNTGLRPINVAPAMGAPSVALPPDSVEHGA